ncbi:MAG TPA: zinc-binding dehydrogenase [Streptosporangiaceae bacterium]|nr:zinc-binding dehydrogenase [Streptosporangiaceae bacterium]
MLIIEVGAFGGPEVLVPRQAPDPVPAPGQVVVRVTAADVLFVDTLIRSGLAVDFFPIRPPYIPGNGVAGLVTATGDGADPSWAGRAVVARTGGNGGWGGYVEQAAVAVSELIPVPDGLSLPEAGALLHDGATAESLLERAAVRPGESVLVTAAAGGMGVVLIQLAGAAGARVIGAARGARKLEVVRAAGADLALDYSEPGWTKQVHEFTGGHGADVVFDGAGGGLGGAAFGATATGGRFSAHGVSDGGFAAIDPKEAAQRGITVHGIPQHEPAGLRRLAAMALADAAAGRIRPVIGQTFALERAADAHAALAARTAIAKTLLLT